jgi:hypothetical protein
LNWFLVQYFLLEHLRIFILADGSFEVHIHIKNFKVRMFSGGYSYSITTSWPPLRGITMLDPTAPNSLSVLWQWLTISCSICPCGLCPTYVSGAVSFKRYVIICNLNT